MAHITYTSFSPCDSQFAEKSWWYIWLKICGFIIYEGIPGTRGFSHPKICGSIIYHTLAGRRAKKSMYLSVSWPSSSAFYACSILSSLFLLLYLRSKMIPECLPGKKKKKKRTPSYCFMIGLRRKRNYLNAITTDVPFPKAFYTAFQTYDPILSMTHFVPY